MRAPNINRVFKGRPVQEGTRHPAAGLAAVGARILPHPLAWLTLPLLLGGCLTLEPLPEVDLTAASWTVRTGQALWQPQPEQPPLAGEILIAHATDGDVLVNFSKPPLPLFTARTADDRWRIDFIERGRAYGGRGGPPRRFVWFQLPALLQGSPPSPPWVATSEAPGRWTIRNEDSGERITVVLDP